MGAITSSFTSCNSRSSGSDCILGSHPASDLTVGSDPVAGSVSAPFDDIKELLEQLHDRYNTPDFIADDPISVPHRFSAQEDIEIAGFLTSTIAWGNRKAIVKSALRMIDFLDSAPYDFVMNASDSELDSVRNYVHRTFNGGDFRAFLLSLRHIYTNFGSMGAFFEREYARTVTENSDGDGGSKKIAKNTGEKRTETIGEKSCEAGAQGDLREVMSRFRKEFFAPPHTPRCEKHLSSIDRGAACKRLCMFLRWMVRYDDRGVDFGLWKGIPPSALYLPLDVHSANTARTLGLLSRRANDWRSVEEVTACLREFDAADPARFDFALFGAGIAGEFK